VGFVVTCADRLREGDAGTDEPDGCGVLSG